MDPVDVALLLPELTPEEIRTVIDLLFRQRRAASALNELPREMIPQVIDAVTDERLANVIERLEIDDLVELVQWIPEDRRPEVVNQLSERKRAELLQAERYPGSSAGRVMTTRFVSLDQKMTAQEAIESLRALGDQSESVLYLYVVDEQRALVGVVPIRRLLSAPPDRRISEMMIRDPLSVKADDDQEEVARIVARFDLLAVPVTDIDGRMLGLITVDDVIDVITEEATEDMYRLAGLTEADRVFVPAHESIRKRLPWMLLNLGTCFAAAWVVGLFERTLEQVVSLAIFMPVVAGMGGNGGIQTLTVITRAIALGEIEFSSGIRAAMKELAVGLSLGIVMGLVSAGIALLWQGNPVLGIALFCSMILTLSVAGLLGAAVPLALKALGMDPALGSGVIVTTFTDGFAFFSFLGIATLLIDGMLV
jgi:magnesium transporter